MQIQLLPQCPIPPLDLPFAQRLALQLRLGHRIIVTATVAGNKREGAVGLGIHRRASHRCGSPVRIDWGGQETTPQTHPWLYLKTCPVLYDDPVLAYQIAQAIEIEDLGGLASLSAQGVAHLPARMVLFYTDVLAARDRLLQERDHVQRKLYQ